MVFPLSQELAKFRDSLIDNSSLVAKVSPLFPADKLVYTATNFTPKGLGLTVRFEVPGEISLKNIKEHCAKSLTVLKQQVYGKHLTGLRCGYKLPREPSDKDGILGSIFIEP